MPPNRRVIGVITAVVTRGNASNMVGCAFDYANTLNSSCVLSPGLKDEVAAPNPVRAARALGSNRLASGATMKKSV